jgi:hypothetical protein
MCYNLTTVEHKEKSMGNDTKNFFNLGVYKNLTQILGNPLIWLLPISNIFITKTIVLKILDINLMLMKKLISSFFKISYILTLIIFNNLLKCQEPGLIVL